MKLAAPASRISNIQFEWATEPKRSNISSNVSNGTKKKQWMKLNALITIPMIRAFNNSRNCTCKPILDSILLPYYTGFDALVSTTFSGNALEGVVTDRIFSFGCSLLKDYQQIVERKQTVPGKHSLDLDIAGLCFIWQQTPPTRSMLRVAAFGGICFDLPSCTQKGMHSDNKMTFSVEKLSQVSFALQRR
ncbi:hypothetical protein CFP56_020848 [Quercus suber]|uniref:Uncharacterized protein n=1 Tax=Quercus suber TaxID=58331 RepID=A0AAW0KE92_QUESU